MVSLLKSEIRAEKNFICYDTTSHQMLTDFSCCSYLYDESNQHDIFLKSQPRISAQPQTKLLFPDVVLFVT